MTGTMWLCPIKWRSWKIIRKENVYGLPCGRRMELDALEIGDLLAIYIHLPVRGIVGVYKVTSRPFIGNELLWGINKSGGVKYQYRIKLKPIPNYIINKDKVIPLHTILGFANNKKGYIIEPSLHNVLFIKLTNMQSKVLLNELAKRSENM